ncbi:MAG: SBBP repeat-containing protein [Candidatus Omnitrophota bacterium]
MKKNKWILTIVFLVLGVMAILSVTIATQVIDGLPSTKGKVGPNQLNNVSIDKNFGKMPLYFIPNQGQLDKRVFYYVQGKDKTIYFTSEGVTFALSEKSKQKRWTVQLEFVGARKDVKPVSLEKTGTVISYFKGKESEWKTGISAASKIMYRDLWPGIDLVYYGTVNQMKYEFVVHPGADPNRIKLAYHGAGDVRENAKGQLEVNTPAGNFHDDTPVAWQEIAGKRVSVQLKYALQTENKFADSYHYGFSVGKYDRNQPLILDPALIVYCGYIGGSESDKGYGIAVDALGCAYITGSTSSSALPLIAGPDLTPNGSYDAFVAKIKADGTGLIYCGFIGGSSSEEGKSISVDASGCAYVTGYTSSTEATFPVKGGPDLTYNNGADAFVAKVSADGTGLVYCGYIGGSGSESGNGVAVDIQGCVYVTGKTSSEGSTFPVKMGPDLTYNGADDAFVAKVKADGTCLEYCGYVGGLSTDEGFGITVDNSGCAYVTGTTQSREGTFPVKIGPYLIFNGGNCDAFVAKVKTDGTDLVYCGYIGGASSDTGYGIAVDRLGYAYVTGYACSNEVTFPIKAGPDLTFNGGCDAFVTKVKTDGTGLVYCGYIGGSSSDSGYGIAVDGLGFAYVAGTAYSTETTFPVKGGPGLTFSTSGSGGDGFVAKVNADGGSLDYCGYIGGTNFDLGTGIAVDALGNAYVCGYTNSSETTFPVRGGPYLQLNYSYDAFVAKISTYHTLNFLAGTGGTLTGNTGQIVSQPNSSQPVTAVPNTGYRFVNWTGTGGFVTSTQNPLTIKNVTSDMTITTNFAPSITPPGWNLVDGLQYNMIAYGKAYKENLLATAGDWIGAFGPGGNTDCRGVAFVGPNGNYYLTIRSNLTSGETISFKLYPFPSGPSVNGSETLSFIDNGATSGLILHFGTGQQDIPLVKGWNWVSFNVLPTNTSLNAVFGSLPNTFEQVKTQTKAAIYTNGSWAGNLTNMDDIANGTMYKIKVTQNRTLSVKGLTLLYEKPIPLVSGWNWTAYLPTVAQPTEAAINSIKSSAEQVKNQTQSIIKTGSVFIGDLPQMEPNKGYKIKLTTPATLVYPYGSASSSGKSGKSPGTPAPSVPWQVIKGNQYNMVARGTVYLDGKPVNEKDSYLIGIGPGGDSDCRSISPVEKGGAFFATILSNRNGETIRFKLYNRKKARIFKTNATLLFKADDLKSNLSVDFSSFY